MGPAHIESLMSFLRKYELHRNNRCFSHIYGFKTFPPIIYNVLLTEIKLCSKQKKNIYLLIRNMAHKFLLHFPPVHDTYTTGL